MNQTQKGSSTVAHDTEREKPPGIFSLHGVRYQVTDVARAAAFYTDHLGFTLERQHLPAFASVSLGDFTLLLSGPGASGSRPMPGGESQQPGGWNRVVLRVAGLPAQIDALKTLDRTTVSTAFSRNCLVRKVCAASERPSPMFNRSC